jgi:hypothetical protein
MDGPEIPEVEGLDHVSLPVDLEPGRPVDLEGGLVVLVEGVDVPVLRLPRGDIGE